MIPIDFIWQDYISLNPDLQKANINTQSLAIRHYLLYGKKEQREYKYKTLIASIDLDFDPVFYLSEYPDVASYYENTKTIPQKEKLLHHYINFGETEFL
jgi:hypothetical protein